MTVREPLDDAGRADRAVRYRDYAVRANEWAERATACGDLLDRLLRTDELPPRLRTAYVNGLHLHRLAAGRHRAVAALYRALAEHFSARCNHGVNRLLPRTIAVVSRARGAAISISVHRPGEAVLGSDEDSQAAQDVELCVGEGPAHDCAVSGPLHAAGPEVSERWPVYARGIEHLGIRTVTAVPLGANRTGSLILYDLPEADAEAALAAASVLRDALRQMEWTPLVAPADFAPSAAVHQATGKIAHQLQCDPPTAAARLRARAFAESVDLDELSREIVLGTREFADAAR